MEITRQGHSAALNWAIYLKISPLGFQSISFVWAYKSADNIYIDNGELCLVKYYAVSATLYGIFNSGVEINCHAWLVGMLLLRRAGEQIGYLGSITKGFREWLDINLRICVGALRPRLSVLV